MSQWVFLNNAFVSFDDAKLSFRDLSIQRGYGIFDFFRVYNGVAIFVEDHLDRFYTSAQSMHLAVAFNREELYSLIQELIARNGIVNSGIRITLTGGSSPDGYSLAEPSLVMAQQHFQPCTKEQLETGIKLMTHTYQRQLSHVKTIDYLMAINLQPKLKEYGADDILYCHDNEVRECPRANIFFVTESNRIITPATGILKGITRKKIVGLSGFTVHEENVSIHDIPSFKEAFITSSTKQILRVSQIDEHIFSQRSPVTNELYRELQQVIDDYSAISAE